MDEPQRPDELSEVAWQATPLEVRQCIALLVTKLTALKARLNQTSQTSSRPPSSESPSVPPRPVRTSRGKPKTKGAQPGHPDQQRDLVLASEASQIVPLRSTRCPACQHALPDALAPVGPPRRQQVWKTPLAPLEVTAYQYHTLVCPSKQPVSGTDPSVDDCNRASVVTSDYDRAFSERSGADCLTTGGRRRDSHSPSSHRGV